MQRVRDSIALTKHVGRKINDLKWMTRRLKHGIGLKRGIYRKIKNGETHLRGRYVELARSVKKNIRLAKRNYEIMVANEAKSDPRGFFKMYRTKTRDRIGLLKTNTGELGENGEDMSQMMNEYFLSVFMQENLTSITERVQVYEGEENGKLRDVIITRQVVQDEIGRLKKKKRRAQTKYSQGFFQIVQNEN